MFRWSNHLEIDFTSWSAGPDQFRNTMETPEIYQMRIKAIYKGVVTKDVKTKFLKDKSKCRLFLASY